MVLAMECAGWWRADLLPLRHMMAERRREKFRRHQNGLAVGLVGLFRNHCCKPFVHSRSCWPHATRSGENER